jgi:hypothetical protein
MATAPISAFSIPCFGANPWNVTTGLVWVVLPALDGDGLAELEMGYGGVAVEPAALADVAGGGAGLVAGGFDAAGLDEEDPPGCRIESTLGTVTPALAQAKVA